MNDFFEVVKKGLEAIVNVASGTSVHVSSGANSRIIINGHVVEGIDYGFINDSCLTELAPENPDGTTTIGMWFRPLPDDIAHKISKKFQLYRS